MRGFAVAASAVVLAPAVAGAVVIDSYTFDRDAEGMGAPQFGFCPLPVGVRPTLSGPFDGTDGNPAGSAGIGSTTLASLQGHCWILSYGTRRTPITPSRGISLRWQEKQTVSGLSVLGGNVIGGFISVEAFDADEHYLGGLDGGILTVTRSTPWTADSLSIPAGVFGPDARTIRLVIISVLRFDSPLSLLVNARFAIDNFTISQ
jgi:hypothetical protein